MVMSDLTVVCCVQQSGPTLCGCPFCGLINHSLVRTQKRCQENRSGKDRLGRFLINRRDDRVSASKFSSNLAVKSLELAKSVGGCNSGEAEERPVSLGTKAAELDQNQVSAITARRKGEQSSSRVSAMDHCKETRNEA